MKVKQLIKKLQKLDPELDVYLSDPGNSNLIWEAEFSRVVKATSAPYFWAEGQTWQFLPDYKFVKLA